MDRFRASKRADDIDRLEYEREEGGAYRGEEPGVKVQPAQWETYDAYAALKGRLTFMMLTAEIWTTSR